MSRLAAALLVLLTPAIEAFSPYLESYAKALVESPKFQTLRVEYREIFREYYRYDEICRDGFDDSRPDDEIVLWSRHGLRNGKPAKICGWREEGTGNPYVGDDRVISLAIDRPRLRVVYPSTKGDFCVHVFDGRSTARLTYLNPGDAVPKEFHLDEGEDTATPYFRYDPLRYPVEFQEHVAHRPADPALRVDENKQVRVEHQSEKGIKVTSTFGFEPSPHFLGYVLTDADDLVLETVTYSEFLEIDGMYLPGARKQEQFGRSDKRFRPIKEELATLSTATGIKYDFTPLSVEEAESLFSTDMPVGIDGEKPGEPSVRAKRSHAHEQAIRDFISRTKAETRAKKIDVSRRDRPVRGVVE
jgi:hypothetical protein